MSDIRITTSFPLGGIPMSSPVCLPRTDTCAATLSPSATIWSPLIHDVGRGYLVDHRKMSVLDNLFVELSHLGFVVFRHGVILSLWNGCRGNVTRWDIVGPVMPEDY